MSSTITKEPTCSIQGMQRQDMPYMKTPAFDDVHLKTLW